MTDKSILVVPSIRAANLKDFLEQTGAEYVFDQVIVVEDNPTRTFDLGDTGARDITHYSWAEIDADLKKDAWIISRRDSAIRSYGFQGAYRIGCRDFIYTLDDDCLPSRRAVRS
jgi:hypothetical protein